MEESPEKQERLIRKFRKVADELHAPEYHPNILLFGIAGFLFGVLIAIGVGYGRNSHRGTIEFHL